ncbi:zinc-dependent alcohol dehydrogenase family protein [Candidatus Nitrospira nitrificans]|uniref:alcohol dehydrogenase n=1 Tax=Candidatus Nitrospira nitrificans TaxID=1742973 RepID=A0A0S4LFS1_9BACT|nr:zinc-dependent alcohol dehydrogenase family protein [Candidatus Nitrospira nitrificans]CUS36439.1 putative alcohol dehydrogenase AdhA [Candidatus Nitrospira nitrificans]
MMKAMVLHQANDVFRNPLQLQDQPVPVPKSDQILVKIHVCGVCRTDLHVVEGELPDISFPLIPGHQAVGAVVQVGAKVSEVKEGDRVGIAWLQRICGQCEFCANGRENLCLQATFTGYQVDGGYAEYAVVPARFAYPIPSIFSDDEAAPLLCAGIIGYRALRLSGIKPGQRLGLYGFGASAHIAIQIARHWGCRVYVSSLKPEHQALARQLGAVWVGGATDTPPEKLHGSIIFAPAGELVPRALRALDRGGTLALAGIHMSPIPSLDYDRDIFGERVIRSVTANTRQDGLDLLREAAAIPIKPHTVRFPLEQANRALQELKAGNFQGAAVLTMQ